LKTLADDRQTDAYWMSRRSRIICNTIHMRIHLDIVSAAILNIITFVYICYMPFIRRRVWCRGGGVVSEDRWTDWDWIVDARWIYTHNNAYMHRGGIFIGYIIISLNRFDSLSHSNIEHGVVCINDRFNF